MRPCIWPNIVLGGEKKTTRKGRAREVRRGGETGRRGIEHRACRSKREEKKNEKESEGRGKKKKLAAACE